MGNYEADVQRWHEIGITDSREISHWQNLGYRFWGSDLDVPKYQRYPQFAVVYGRFRRNGPPVDVQGRGPLAISFAVDPLPYCLLSLRHAYQEARIHDSARSVAEADDELGRWQTGSYVAASIAHFISAAIIPKYPGVQIHSDKPIHRIFSVECGRHDSSHGLYHLNSEIRYGPLGIVTSIEPNHGVQTGGGISQYFGEVPSTFRGFAFGEQPGEDLGEGEVPAKPKKFKGAKAKPPLKEFGIDPNSGNPILLKDGKFGPYVTDGQTNAALKKQDSVEELSMERAVELLAEKRS